MPKLTIATLFITAALTLVSQPLGAEDDFLHKLPSFEISLDGKGLNILSTVTVKNLEVLTLPSSPELVSFQYGRNEAKERYGAFQIKEGRPEWSCQFYKWKSSAPKGPALGFVAQLKGSGECPEEATFWILEQSPSHLVFWWDFGLKQKEGLRAEFRFSTPDKENFLGLGNQYTHLELKGHKFPIISQEQGHGRGLQPISLLQSLFAPGLQGDPYTTYAPAAMFLSNKRRAFFFPHYEYGEIDFTGSHHVRVKYWSHEIRGEIFIGESPKSLVEQYTARIGRQPALPSWAHQGAIVGLMGGSQKVQQISKELKKRDVPVAAWWLQDWSGVRSTPWALRLNWNWQLDEVLYPHWHELNGWLKNEGQRVMGYINPFISKATVVRPPQRHLFDEAQDRGYLVLDQRGNPYEVEMGGFKAYLIDLFQKDAREWLKGIMKYMVEDAQLSGWMADFGEAYPFDAAPTKHISPSEAHHIYIEEWVKLNREFIEENGLEDEVFFFNRSGLHSTPRYSSMYWLGDQTTTWDELDGLVSSLRALLSSGLSGWQHNHSDIGGYFSFRFPPLVRIERSQELLFRWMEMNAFTAMFRTHEGSNPHLNSQFYSNKESLDFFAHTTQLFVDLYDYRTDLFHEAQKRGLPLVRHMFLEFPEDPETFAMKDQFMLGSDLLAAPVLTPQGAHRRAYLPRGTWTHLWSEKTYNLDKGTWVVVDAPLGKPAIFFRPENTKLKEFSERTLSRTEDLFEN